MFFGFILASGYTHPIQEFGSSAILGRMVWADVFGIATIVGAFIAIRPKFNQIAIGALLFVLALTPGIAASASSLRTAIELCIFLFLIFTFVTGSQIFSTDKDLVNLLRALALAAIIASGFGIWENSTNFTGLPRLFPDDGRDYRGATFRNSGQAGSYLMVAVAALIPFRYGEFAKRLSVVDRRLFDISILMSGLCIVMTVKIAAYIGISIGIFGFAVQKRKLGFVVPVVLGLLLFQYSIPWAQDQFPRLTNRFRYKTETRLNPKIITDDEGFVADNYGKAMEAFSDNPLLGSGIMGFHGVYSKYEVHSTPMKLLGETGLLGCLGYLIFVTMFVKEYSELLRYPRNNPYREALVMMLPFLLGCAVSWIYTFHFRKREFWIMMVIVVVTLRLMKCYGNKSNGLNHGQ